MLQGGVQLLLKWCGFYKPDISGTQEMVSWALMVVSKLIVTIFLVVLKKKCEKK